MQFDVSKKKKKQVRKERDADMLRRENFILNGTEYIPTS